MASEKLCFKDYLNCPDDKELKKTRRKMNAKSHKKRVYGLDWGTSGPVNLSGAAGGTGAVGEGVMSEMHNGILPGAFTPDVLGGVQSTMSRRIDTKKENKRSAPKKVSLRNYLQTRARAEDEEDFEFIDDEELEDFDDEIEGDEELDDEILDDEELDDEELDDLDFNGDDFPEHDLDREFVDPNEEIDDEELEDEDLEDEILDDEEIEDEFGDEELDGEEVGRFKDFFKLDGEEEEEDLDDEYCPSESGIDDEIIDKIDDVTGVVTDWWREEPEGSDEEDLDPDEYERKYDVDPHEEEQEAGVGPGPAPGSGVGATSGSDAGPPKIDRARLVFQRMIQMPDATRSDIIAAFVQQVDVTQSTAVSYYERLAKEAGITGQGGEDESGMGQGAGDDEMGQGPVDQLPADTDLDLEDDIEDSGEPNRRGIVRTVDNAHMVYKRQTEEGTFEELWVYNVGSDMKDELKIRRAVLAGTDIPQNQTQSEDGSQSYKVTTMGNAQILHITGLPN